MKVLVAIDSFKGSLPATALAAAIATGIKEAAPGFTVVQAPIADGGEGMATVLVEALGGKTVTAKVANPLGKEITTAYAVLGDGTAVIETAAAAGLTLLPPAGRNPMHTTTLGVGQLIKAALATGCRNFIMGLGGSATNDGGMGMLQALGCRFLDEHGQPLAPEGASLGKVVKIDTTNLLPELQDCRFTAACDVDNPFYGPRGAARVFARQKGANEKEIELLDQGMEHFAGVVAQTFGAQFATLPGTGAAGGLGGACRAVLRATLKPGTDVVFSLLNLPAKVRWADLIITGEGRLDAQTAMGKAPAGVARLAKTAGKPVIALAGSIGEGASQLYDLGLTAMFAITDTAMPLAQAMQPDVTARLVTKRTKELFRLIKALA